MIGEYGVFAEIIMAVATTFAAGSGAGPVLDHSVDALISPAVFHLGDGVGLQSFGICLGKVDSQIRVFAEGIVVAKPARISAYIYLRKEGGGEAERTVFFRHNFAESLHHFRRESGGKT